MSVGKTLTQETHKGIPSHAQRCGSMLPTQKDPESCCFSCPNLKLFHGFLITLKLIKQTRKVSQNQLEEQFDELR